MSRTQPVPRTAVHAAGSYFPGPSTSVLLTESAIAAQPEGNLAGLKPGQLKGLSRLGRRHYVSGGRHIDVLRELAGLSRSLGRQIGLLIDRQGRVQRILVGDAAGIFIPRMARGRESAGRLRGVRLLHTHLTPDGLSREDLMDLLFLRLDSLSVLTVNPDGDPVSFQNARLLPPGPGNEPYALTPLLPWDRVDVDFTAEAEALEAELSRVLSETREASGPGAEPDGRAGGSGERAVLVSVAALPHAVQERHLDELQELARTAGVTVAGRLVQRVASVHPRHILGKGKLAELEVLALQGQASLIVFDGELTPAQLGALAELTERKVLDRTQLILDIFAARAGTREGKLQVEAAQLAYALPRLAGRNRAMDRLMGGIGGRGPGETKLETDRRRVRERMARLRTELEAVRRQRAFTRERRSRQGLPVAALVGYTNAGKSTLLNALTRSEVPAENKLFATLDPTTRRLRVPEEHELVLTDTVGFIRDLPRELAEAFRATLEELHAADLLIHVADASHPDLERQVRAVEDILADMGLADVPRIMVLNKWDRVPDRADVAGDGASLDAAAADREALRLLWPDAVPLSAIDRTGLNGLTRRIALRLNEVAGGQARREPRIGPEPSSQAPDAGS